jgi:hypothetical protein
MLRGLPENNTRSVLVKEQLLGEHLPSVVYIGIHPSIFWMCPPFTVFWLDSIITSFPRFFYRT